MSTSTETRETFALDLDPKVPLPEQIRRGNYSYVDPAITPEHFTLTLSGKREVVLFDDPHGTVFSKEMIARMKQEGCVPATLDDALAMGAQFPDRQCQNTIVFLGTVWPDPRSRRRVPVLGKWVGRRMLSLFSGFGGGWRDSYRFAAVREK